MDYSTTIILLMELLGTIAFASSGALLAIEKNMDLFGINVLGVVTACGGGLIRDLILDVNPPSVFQNPLYALVAILTSTLAFCLCYWRRHEMSKRLRTTYDSIMMIMDSIGLAIFTVVGVNAGIHAGYADNTFLLVFLGTITGVGGGLLRDMMASVPPYIFVRHVYASASIVGALVCTLLHRFLGNVPAMIISTLVVFLIRCLAAHYRWNLPRLKPLDS